MPQQPPKLSRGTRIRVLLVAFGFTVIIPIGAGVVAIIAYLALHSTAIAGDAFFAFLFLGALAASIDRGMYKAQLKVALRESDEASAAAPEKATQATTS